MATQTETEKSILILVQNLPVPFDRRVWMEATTLQQNGYQVNVICPNSEKHPELRQNIDGVEIYRFPMQWEGRGIPGMLIEYAWSLAWMTLLTAWISLVRRICITHICNPPDLLFLAIWPAKLIRKSRVIFDQHDLGPELWEAKGHSASSVLGKAIAIAEKLTYRCADVVIATNESYKQIAISRGSKSPSDVFVVRSAPRRDFAVAATIPARDIHSSARLVYLGTMGSQEGIDLLLEAFQQISASRPNLVIQLDLIGDGPERAKLEKYASELGIETKCTFHGRVHDSELRRIISEADLAINPDRPSKMNDLSSMNKIVEYMALGVPIVQFSCLEGQRTADAAAVAVNEPTAAALASAIISTLADKSKRTEMKIIANQRFHDFLAWEHQQRILLAAFQKVRDAK